MNWFDALALLANVGSLVGFALTLYVYYRVRKLREHYALIGRVPVDAQRLKHIASELADMNYAEVPRQKLLGALGEMKAALESIARNIGPLHSPDYAKLRDQIDRVTREGELDARKLDAVYERAVQLARRAVDVVEDRKHRLSP